MWYAFQVQESSAIPPEETSHWRESVRNYKSFYYLNFWIKDFFLFPSLPYSCKYCEEHFMTRAEQLAHSNTVHAGEGDFVCHLCGKKMKTILSLENHVKLHSGLKEFKCDMCDSAFATNHSLKCHKKIHDRGPDNSLQYVCHVCQKPMSNKSSLNQHLKTHQSTKPHQCQHCSAS